MTTTQIKATYERINPALLDEQIRRELKEIAQATENFSDTDLVDVFAENFADLYRIIQTQHPGALDKDGGGKTKAAPKTASSKIVSFKKAKPAASVKAGPVKTVTLPPVTKGEEPKYQIGQAVTVLANGAAGQVRDISANGKVYLVLVKGKPVMRLSETQISMRGKPAKKAEGHAATPHVAAIKPQAGRPVERITPETEFLRAFVASNGRIKSFNAGRLLLSRLQKAIKERVIRKTSPVATEILYMQTRLLEVLRAAEKDGKDFVKITIPDEKLPRLVALAGGERLYGSIPLMKAYISIQATRPDAKRAGSLLKRMENADLSADPYAAKVSEMARNLKRYLSDTQKPLPIEQSDLSGLMAAPLAGQRSNLRANGRISAHDLGRHAHASYPFAGRYAELLGKPAIGFKMMVHGEPGVGKSTEAMRLARYLAQRHGRVLYLSSEEHGSSTQAAKLKLVGGPVAGWDFDRDIPQDVGTYSFLVVDSVNRSGFTLEMFRSLCDKYPDLSMILIFQTTKSGQFKGDKDWEHDCDIVVRGVAHGVLQTTKNRYAPLAQVKVF